MNKSILSTIALIILSAIVIYGQSYTIKGKVTDAVTNEAIIGAVVNIAEGKGTITDIEGNYTLKLDAGNYVLICNYVGYASQKQKIGINGDRTVDFKLESKTLSEVEIIADVAKIRETPIAASTISLAKIQEELGARDITLIANTTPGAYASEAGGGSGDSRINIRGVDQRNVAVLVDGVPVNDMENGQVYWSNWDGLAEVTKTIQIQRGLGASKLAIPSMGGTMNILTKSTSLEDGIAFKYDIGSFNYNRISLAVNKNINSKLSLIMAGSRKTGDAFAEETFIDAWSYFSKLQYRPNSKHFFALSLTGAPQQHGQRTDRTNLIILDREFARKLGIDEKRADSITRVDQTIRKEAIDTFSRGGSYNPSWGYYNGNRLNAKINYYHKPILNLTHLYNINSRLTLSTVLYASNGNGGGTNLQLTSNLERYTNPNQDKSLSYLKDTLGQIDFDKIKLKNNNKKDSMYGANEIESKAIIQSSINSHYWYGGISSINYKISENLKFLGGLDLRYYKGIHINRVDDLLGGNYYFDSPTVNALVPNNADYIDNPVNNIPQKYRDIRKKQVGDTIFRNYRGLVKWGGGFAQIEYSSNKINAFATASYALKSYQRVDYFVRKDLKINNKWHQQQIGIGDTAFVSNGVIKIFNSRFSSQNGLYGITVIDSYKKNGDTISFINIKDGVRDTVRLINPERYTINSNNTRAHQSVVKVFPSYTLKAGFNYKLLDNLNIFVNGGILQIAPAFDNVFSINNQKVFVNKESKPQNILTGEVGAGYVLNQQLTFNINAYYTDWKNRPFTRTIPNTDGSRVSINGIDANFKGMEVDANYKPFKFLDIEGFYTYGEWRYTSNSLAYPTDEAGNITDTLFITTNNVHLGDAPQNQASLALRFSPYKGFYIKPRWSYYDRYFADLDPVPTQKEGTLYKDTWQIPAYSLVDLSMGYNFKIEGTRIGFNLIINNLLNKKFISDARDGFTHDVTSASIYIGAPRRFTISMRLEF